MNPISFSKYHGLGNDFILFDDRSSLFPIEDKEKMTTLCHRNRGIGADGIILLQKSENHDFCMRIFNRDGNEAACSGNGLLCLLRFLKDHELIQDTCCIETMRGKVLGTYQNGKIFLTMPDPKIYQLALPIEIEGKIIDIAWVDSGVPHVVYFVEDVSSISLNKIGKFLRFHPHFYPEGTNVNVANIHDSYTVSVRTFERGVENETLSCGSGAVAVAISAFLLGKVTKPVKILFHHGSVNVDFHVDKKELFNIKLIGEANFVFSGNIFLEKL